MIKYVRNDPDTIKLIEKGVPLDVLERRMRPSRDSTHGMLGSNESLIDIIVSDNSTLHEIGMDYETLAQKIEEVSERKEIVSLLTNGYLSLIDMNCGNILCPWECSEYDGDFALMIFDPKNEEHRNFLELWKKRGIPRNEEYKNLFTEEPITVISGIMPPLIREHHFFEGKETPYRCDPKQLIKYLDIQL